MYGDVVPASSAAADLHDSELGGAHLYPRKAMSPRKRWLLEILVLTHPKISPFLLYSFIREA
jgi:hypothetical protein